MKLMKKLLLVLLAGLLTACTVNPNPDPDPDPDPDPIPLSAYEINLRRDVLALMASYPGGVVDVERDGDTVLVITENGSRLIYDDFEVKDFETDVLPDLQDTMEVLYYFGGLDGRSSTDPGRIKPYTLLDALYGHEKAEIADDLQQVAFFGQNLNMNAKYGAYAALSAAVTELGPLMTADKSTVPYITPSSGTWNYRLIAGTTVLSLHAYGVAIDFKFNSYDYWRWIKTAEQETVAIQRIADYPDAIYAIMEKYGFIWGGKWWHFDTVHYEYRPELIFKAKYFSEQPADDEPWYTGIDETDLELMALVERIDEQLTVEMTP
jgi:hypothetical protein